MGSSGVRISASLLRLASPALYSMSGDSDTILMPGASQEALQLLEEVIKGEGESTGSYSYLAIQEFLSLAEALGLGELDSVATPPNSQELDASSSPVPSLSRGELDASFSPAASLSTGVYVWGSLN